MTSKQSPAKVTLGMIKGKSITMSVPVIRYHASDDELEELYPSTDDEKQLTPESEKPSPKCSPFKSLRNKFEDDEGIEGTLERRSISIDGNLSEGTPPSDPWKVLSDIKGKITKTFEDKLSEIKSDKKKKSRRKRKSCSVSDTEAMGDATPTEENMSEKQENDSPSSVHKSSSRFVGFSQIRVGLKTKSSEEDSVESGVEAAEFTNDCSETASVNVENQESYLNLSEIDAATKTEELPKPTVIRKVSRSTTIKPEKFLSHFKNEVLYYIIYQILLVLVAVLCSYHFIPLPQYILGLFSGVLVTLTLSNIMKRIQNFLKAPIEGNEPKVDISVLEIPAAEELCVLERFEGWLNELPYAYNPDNYHVARTKPVYFKLEGETLRIMETKNRIPKRAIWDEPKHKLNFCRRRTYNMADAVVNLLPEGLIRRRRWSKKYPICITFQEESLTENTALKESSDEELLGDHSSDTIAEEEETDDDISQAKSTKDASDDSREDTDEDSTSKLYIFARTDREKEDWYRRLVNAVNFNKKRNSISSIGDAVISLNALLAQQSNNESKSPTPTSFSPEIPSDTSYINYMNRLLEAEDPETTDNLTWFNCLVGRILFDVHKCSDTINLIQDKIQRKLSNIKLPYFMESLIVTEIVIGQGSPIFQKVTKPTMNERGLWFDLDVNYKGCMTMTVETKLNLMKLTRAGSVSINCDIDNNKPKPARSPMFDSDVEDSPETSTEDEDSAVAMPNSSKELTPTQSSGRKFLNMVDKLTASKCFQQAAELSYIRRAMEGLSNTEIRLMVSVSGIEGNLSVNIPPPPSDRLWYGFKPVPKILLTVKPAVGERAVNIVFITKWIETKLLREFEKVVVLPNMDDLITPLCPNYPYNS
ncbi:testis-expressed protein 2 [Prorops nasuta]|uniref:testis-expressed protein 2 n=1 Tax=Prorops nasuta TaxID=863751 RepID=UPI0034CDE228